MRIVWCSFCLILFGSGLATGPAWADCVDYGDYIRWADTLDIPGDPTDIVAEGNLALVVVDGTDLYLVRRLPDPGVLSHIIFPGGIAGIALFGSFAYVAEESYGDPWLRVIDVSNPSNPQIVSNEFLGGVGAPHGLALEGSTCYITSDRALTLLDVSNPLDPHVVSYAWSWVYPLGAITVSGSLASVGSGEDLRLFDIEDPADPQEVGTVATPGLIQDLAASGGLVFIADDLAGLQVIDVADPQNPQIVGGAPTPAAALSVALSGGYAYLGGDVDDSPGHASIGGLQVMDITDPTAPRVIARVLPPGSSCHGVTILGNRLLVGCPGWWSWNPDWLCELDITNPQAPPVVGRIDLPAQIRDLAVEGDMAYVTLRDNRFQVIDVSDPESPRALGSVGSGWPAGFTIRGDYAYIAAGEEYRGLQIVDISDPLNPRTVGWVLTGSDTGDVAVSGRYAYVVGSSFQVIDIVDPANPRLIETQYLEANTIDLSGSYAYLASEWGLYVVDISNGSPSVVATMTELGPCMGVVVSPPYAYVTTYDSDGPAGLHVVDISNPLAPRNIGAVEIVGGGGFLSVSDGYAYVGSCGVSVVDVANPEKPRIVGGMLSADCSGVAVANGFVYAEICGFGVLPMQCPAGSGVPDPGRGGPFLQAFPNPMSQEASLRFSLPREDRVVVSILDVSGRIVRRLAGGRLEAGTHELIWNGQDDNGRAVVPGIYLARVRREGKVETARVVRLK